LYPRGPAFSTEKAREPYTIEFGAVVSVKTDVSHTYAPSCIFSTIHLFLRNLCKYNHTIYHNKIFYVFYQHVEYYLNRDKNVLYLIKGEK